MYLYIVWYIEVLLYVYLCIYVWYIEVLLYMYQSTTYILERMYGIYDCMVYRGTAVCVPPYEWRINVRRVEYRGTPVCFSPLTCMDVWGI